jgi:hypothetical protein
MESCILRTDRRRGYVFILLVGEFSGKGVPRERGEPFFLFVVLVALDGLAPMVAAILGCGDG